MRCRHPLFYDSGSIVNEIKRTYFKNSLDNALYGTPDVRNSARAEEDLRSLHPTLRHSLKSKYTTGERHNRPKDAKYWRDIVYGSVVQLQSESDTGVYLHSFYKQTPGGSKQQQVGGYDYPDLNTKWIIIRANMTGLDAKHEIPPNVRYLRNGDEIRLRHVSTRRCLHSHNVRTLSYPKSYKWNEVSGYGSSYFDGDENDWWTVELVDTGAYHGLTTKEIKPSGFKKIDVRALESTFRLKHQKRGCYLYVSEKYLPGPDENRKEIICGPDTKLTSKSIWRFTSNEHDYLPHDTPLLTFPRLTFWRKVVFTHRQMWSLGIQGSGSIITCKDSRSREASNPLAWPLAKSIIPVWDGYKRQIAIIGNPVVWWTGIFGVLTYIGTKVIFSLREKRQIFETGRVGEFKRIHINNLSNLYFMSWTFHYVPFIFIANYQVNSPWFMHHYFPSLYFSILLTCSVLSGLSEFIPRRARFSFFAILIILTVMVFFDISPLSYGSSLDREHCERLNRRLSTQTGVRRGNLDCSLAPERSSIHVQFSVPKEERRKDRIVASLRPNHQHDNNQYAPGASLPISSHKKPSAMTTAAVQPIIHSDDLSGRLFVSKPRPMKIESIIDMNLPPSDKSLPNEDIILLSYQTPPQRWDESTLKLMLGRYKRSPYQRQQIEQLLLEKQDQRRSRSVQQMDEEASMFQDWDNESYDEYSAEYERSHRQFQKLKMISAAAEYASRVELLKSNKVDKINNVLENLQGHDEDKVPDQAYDKHENRQLEEEFDEDMDDDDEAENIEPSSISVGSEEELKRVLKQLQEEGVRAEVVRGSLTETIYAVEYNDQRDIVEGGVDGDDGSYYIDHDAEDYYGEAYYEEDESMADDEDEEYQETISVRNK
ncbi:hypothetical protein BGZ76_009308 [Entomortierella beljakovae]|nr:hypothetical protein BGZ76_009308 [Entomortierella beljakovae]